MRVGTLADLGAEPGMPSMPSLACLVADRTDFPILKAGASGVAYEVDLDAASAFVRANWRDGRRRTPEAEAALAFDRNRQASLPGLDPVPALTPTDAALTANSARSTR